MSNQSSSTSNTLQAPTKAGNRSPSQSKDSTAKTPMTSREAASQFVLRNGAGGGTASANTSGRSPVSPSRITRLQEKEDMQNLNDRLVIYIDTVRRLETENNRLQSIVYSYNESSTRDINEIKKLYENELEDAKRLIDELAKEKARFEIDFNKYKSDNEEAMRKLTAKEKDLKSLEAKYKTSESEKIEYKSRYEAAVSEHEREHEELKQLRPMVVDYEKQLQKLKKQLEDETLLRVDLENKNQTLKEDLMFKSQVYGKELDQLKSSKRVEIEQVDVRLRDEYDSKLVNELQRIRDEADYKILEMREEVERRYLNKHNDIEASNKRYIQLNTSLREEVTTLKAKIDDLSGEIKSLSSKLTSNEAKLKELEDKLRREKQKYDKDMADKDAELVSSRKEIDDLLAEYQELYDIKIALDMEISAYRKLLESEEQRLNISATSTAHQSNLGASFIGGGDGVATATRSGKKRRIANTQDPEEIETKRAAFQSTSTSTSGVEIDEHDYDGRSVRLTNTKDHDIAVGNWVIKRTADGQVTEYKFNKSAVIKPKQSINVWSSNAGVTHEPPNDLVMNSQRWFTGDCMVTSLLDKEAHEQARRESKRTRQRSTPTRQAAGSAERAAQPSTVQKLFGLWKS